MKARPGAAVHSPAEATAHTCKKPKHKWPVGRAARLRRPAEEEGCRPCSRQASCAQGWAEGVPGRTPAGKMKDHAGLRPPRVGLAGGWRCAEGPLW